MSMHSLNERIVSDDRHAQGAHYTSEADIQKVVLPTIDRPWEARIEAAKTLKELNSLLAELRAVTVLDPACGSGNFLYIAYRELVRLGFKLTTRIHEAFGAKAKALIGTRSGISIKRFFGIEKNLLSVELAKVTLVLAKELPVIGQHSPARVSASYPFVFHTPGETI
ncbi:MAG: hypothetical protein K8S99_14430 [Planctomycetes bacterium]|nr:hypothetical protein [Planctomycetota bacterium]